MEAFFTVDKPTKKKKKNTSKIVGCESCGKYKECKHGKMGVTGNGDKGILIIGGMVSEREESRGRPFSDLPSLYLQDELAKIGIDMRRDCWLVHSVQCYSSKTTPKMLDGCRRKLEQMIWLSSSLLILFNLWICSRERPRTC